MDIITVTSLTEDVCIFYVPLTTHEALLHLLGKIILQTAYTKFRKIFEEA